MLFRTAYEWNFIWWHPFERICSLHWEQGRLWANHPFNSMLYLIVYSSPSTQKQPVIIEHHCSAVLQIHEYCLCTDTFFNYTKGIKYNKVVPEAKKRKKNLYKHKIEMFCRIYRLFFPIQHKQTVTSGCQAPKKSIVNKCTIKLHSPYV